MESVSDNSIPKKTEFFCGPEATTTAAVRWLSRVKERIDIVMGPEGPSVAIGYEPLRNEHLSMCKRGVKGRWITEITKDNLPYCKEAIEKFHIEIRNLDGTKGAGFAVSEAEYAGSGALEAKKPIPELLTSTIGAIREQHQFLFDTLWSKAIPAELKIKGIEEGIEPEKTEFFYGAEATTTVILRCFSRVIKNFDAVIDYTGASIAMDFGPFRNAYLKMHERGINIRWVTEITKDNLSYCKDAMKYVEIRHLDNVKGNFAVSENEYVAAATMEEAKPLPTLIYSTGKMFRDQQQYLFDTLWNKAIPAEQRIREIEEGIPIERTEVISDPHAIMSLYQHIISEAKEEILLILPTVNAFARQKRLGILDLLKKQLSEKGVKIRLLVPVAEGTTNEQDNLDLERQGVQINRLSHNPPQKGEKAEEQRSTRVTVVIVDKRTSLVIELDDDEKESFDDAIGSAVLSTGRSLASSYARIFGSLWLETLLAARLAETDKLQKEFINIAAHELRTPITPILTALFLAENIKKLDGTSQTVLSESETQMIQRNAKRLEKLANDILTVSNIEARGIHLRKEKGNLDTWISEELSTASAFVPSDTTIDFVFMPALKDSSSLRLLIDADKSKIFEVLSNLIRNAIKFSPNGGKITVTTSRSEDEKSAMVKIHDTGTGIDPEIYTRLFQKFASSYEYGATGLGLYISRLIVEAHGGKIWAENNKDGVGATFTFTLPLIDPKRTGF